MGKVRRKFDDQFKQEVVTKIKSGELSLTGACRKYQISPGCMTRWLTKFDPSHPEHTKSIPKISTRERELERENLRLKEKLADLFMQVDLLKKAESWMEQRKKERSSIITSRNLARFKKAAKS